MSIIDVAPTRASRAAAPGIDPLAVCMDSPVGRLRIRASADAITAIDFHADDASGSAAEAGGGAARLLAEAMRQLQAYFAGRLREFDLPLAPRGTPFQLRTWRSLQEIPYGTTISYGELARRIDRPTAARAVGAANGCNPIPIVVPCHRVIGSDGSLTGYGGGLEIKRKLLQLEGLILAF